jgi:hypothetical protein
MKLCTVAYVGKKESQEDTIAGTGILWLPGSQHEVTQAQAHMLAQHTDSWAIVSERETDEQPKEIASKPAKKVEQEEPFPHVNLEAMTKAQIAEHALRTFNHKLELSPRISKQSLIDAVVNLQNVHSRAE